MIERAGEIKSDDENKTIESIHLKRLPYMKRTTTTHQLKKCATITILPQSTYIRSHLWLFVYMYMWNGNSASEFNIQSWNERTNRMNKDAENTVSARILN